MNMVQAIIRPERLTAVKDALEDAGFVGMNVVSVTGRGAQRGIVHQGRGGQPVTIDMLPKVKMEHVDLGLARCSLSESRKTRRGHRQLHGGDPTLPERTPASDCAGSALQQSGKGR